MNQQQQQQHQHGGSGVGVGMYVVKRNGARQPVQFDKITARLSKLCYGLDAEHCDPVLVAQKVSAGVYKGVSTVELDELAAETAAALVSTHPDYGVLAARIVISNMHKSTIKSFAETVRRMHAYVNPKTGRRAPMVSDALLEVVEANAELLDSFIRHDRDYAYDYFGYKTLERSYLLRMDGRVVERPQHLLMRVSLGIHGKDVAAALDTYRKLSDGLFTHASPTLFNAGTPIPTLASCYLLTMKEDSIDGIFATLTECAQISKCAGGIGVAISDIRATGTAIAGTNGVSNGIIPMLRVFNSVARYVDQCFDGDTVVYTDKGPQAIKALEKGADRVLTHTGQFQLVKDVLAHRVAVTLPALAITAEHLGAPVVVTDLHQVLAVKARKDSEGTLQDRLRTGHAQRAMVDARDLEVGDYLCFPSPSVLPVHLPYTEYDGWMYASITAIQPHALKPATPEELAATAGTEAEALARVHNAGGQGEYAVVYDLEVEEDHTYVTPLGTVHNGGGKRKGAFAAYLEPWHPDVFDFLELRKNHGQDEMRARDMFLALWVPDMFMRRVQQNGNWSLMCPHECPGLADVWGEEFEALYTRYEAEGRARKVVKAQQLWFAILDAQTETGTPYMLYKDRCNRLSNQQNLGTIRCSNLCSEVVEYSSPEETAVCNLASIALPRFVKDRRHDPVSPTKQRKLVGSLDAPYRYFDFEAFAEVVATATRNLNKVIDVTHYPVETARRSNLRHRPIGLGVQGLADVFILLGLPFDAPAAQQLNKDIFEAMYFAALRASMELARDLGAYETYTGCPISRGILQPDHWGVATPDGRWNWSQLRADIAQYGVRNSLLVAPMPTASTSQILGNCECIEPLTSNVYTRRTLAGEFVCVNNHLLSDLMRLGLWTPVLKNELIAANGSVLGLEIPAELKAVYRTVWEIKQRGLVDMNAGRAPYIDQNQSFNIFMENCTHAKLTSLHFYGWEKGLLSTNYYVRSRAAADAIKFTVDQQALSKAKKHEENMAGMVCSLTNKDECLMCGS